ncbi:MAG TPA: heavy metal translocating P-type ATPase [Gemmatimonadaceae bacterium]
MSGRSDAATACELRVAGMDCASCAATIERSLRRLDGVRDVRVDVVGGRVRVGFAEGAVSRGALAGAIRRAGYAVEEDAPAAASGVAQQGPRAAQAPGRGEPLRPAIVAGLALVLGLAAKWTALPAELSLALLGVATVAGGWYVVPRGLRAARDRALDMHFLMSVAAAGAWAIGEPEEAAATLFLFAIAELLESRSMDRARHAISALMDLSPAEASVRRDGVERRVPVAEVAVGESIVVRPGEKIPVDGEVVAGRSSVSEAPITGESMPVDKESGAAVFAGSINGHGVLELRSSRPASDTTLARIIHAVEEAQASRAPSQTFVDRFARVYTPLVVAAAVLIAVVPPLLALGSWESWIYRALAMLVVACPCALVISTPVAIVSGLAGAARSGVLVKGGAFLERAARTTTIAFDKTGTLTEGRPAVTDVVPLDGVPPDELLRLALGVERWSEHPIAVAVLAEGARRGIAPPASRDFESLPGRGARARVGGQLVGLEHDRHHDEQGLVRPELSAALARLEAEGKTAVVVVARDVAPAAGGAPRAIGVLGIADRIRPNAAAAIRALRECGIRHVVMLTGDNAGTAQAVASAVGVDEVHAALLPDDKVRVVRELEARGAHVAFVGDGVNDAPAMAAAGLSVAMGAAGTDVALETADIALMADDLEKLPLAIRLSRKTLGIIKQNISVALAIKAVFLVLAATGVATLWMAVAADMGGSLLVVANGMRALRPER